MALNIDLLGDLVESSSLSVNPQFYGEAGLHNMGHVILAYAHDPEYKYRVFRNLTYSCRLQQKRKN